LETRVTGDQKRRLCEIDLVRWMVALPGATALPTRSHRQIDEGATSILLNIAEGNGRYSKVDHRHFLDLADNKGLD
jgi:four helix bundle protein